MDNGKSIFDRVPEQPKEPLSLNNIRDFDELYAFLNTLSGKISESLLDQYISIVERVQGGEVSLDALPDIQDGAKRLPFPANIKETLARLLAKSAVISGYRGEVKNSAPSEFFLLRTWDSLRTFLDQKMEEFRKNYPAGNVVKGAEFEGKNIVQMRIAIIQAEAGAPYDEQAIAPSLLAVVKKLKPDTGS